MHDPENQRDPDIQRLIDTIAAAIAVRRQTPSPLATLADNIFAAAARETGTPRDDATPVQLPVCRHLAPALVTAATGSAETAAVADAFSHLSPRLQWRKRPHRDTDPADFADNHANALLVGPDGLEERHDIFIGASLVAPDTLYPDHFHPPEELYLVLSPGEWRNTDTDWHAPGIGGLMHNPPGITHAMRAGASAPLFAIWCLWQQ